MNGCYEKYCYVSWHTSPWHLLMTKSYQVVSFNFFYMFVKAPSLNTQHSVCMPLKWQQLCNEYFCCLCLSFTQNVVNWFSWNLMKHFTVKCYGWLVCQHIESSCMVFILMSKGYVILCISCLEISGARFDVQHLL